MMMRPSRCLAWLATASSLLITPLLAAQDTRDDDEEQRDENEDQDDDDQDYEDQDDEDQDHEDQGRGASSNADGNEPPTQQPEPGTDAIAAGSDAAANGATADGNSYPRFDLGGFARGGFRFRVVPDALPKDEVDYRFSGRAGLGVTGWAHRMWRARLKVEFRSSHGSATNIDTTFDTDGDGFQDAFTLVEGGSGIAFEEATAAFVPIDELTIEAGIMRIPFTLQQQSKNTNLLFPSRSAANNVFLAGPDVGALVRANLFDGIVTTSLGVFNGDSMGLQLFGTESRGVALSYRGDVSPFGAFEFGESDLKRGPFRLGAGFGLTYQPATLFDIGTGTEPRSVNDLRLSGSLRMAWRGFYFAAEYFRRQQTDDFSFRPEVADGAYGQLAYVIPITDDIGLEPIARAGFVADDQTFDPRITGYIDAGLNLYPILGAANPDGVRLAVLYLGERRFSEREEAHGGATFLQIKF